MHVSMMVLIVQRPPGCHGRSRSRPCPLLPHLRQALPREREALRTDGSTKQVDIAGCGCCGAAGRYR
jgi:hypothetical protein